MKQSLIISWMKKLTFFSFQLFTYPRNDQVSDCVKRNECFANILSSVVSTFGILLLVSAVNTSSQRPSWLAKTKAGPGKIKTKFDFSRMK